MLKLYIFTSMYGQVKGNILIADKTLKAARLVLKEYGYQEHVDTGRLFDKITFTSGNPRVFLDSLN